VIPDAAVEAARLALEDALGHGFDDPGTIRKVLDAAAPHIISAWINDTGQLPGDLPGYGPEGRTK